MKDLELIEEWVYKMWDQYSMSNDLPWVRNQTSGEFGSALAIEFNQSAIGYLTFIEKLDEYLMGSGFSATENGEDIIIYKS